ncbi:MAG TPA: hypothetical protein VNT76_22835, partial [Candidatus Binatus sp.]|nr:hypothetical protein [Candidatus Binatus sp.]
MAIKKDAVEEYSQLLARCGVTPIYTLAALARSAVCPQPIGTCALLDVGLNHSELISFESGVPAAVRIFPWGDQNPGAIDDVSAALTKSVNGSAAVRKLFLSGRIAGLKDKLAGRLGSIECEPLSVPSGEGQSAAVLGLKKSTEENRALLLFQSEFTDRKPGLAQPVSLKLAVVAAALVVGLFLLPYVEAFLLRDVLAKKVAKLKTEAARLPIIDRELDFLQALKQSQPPYLDTLYLLAKSAPSGSRIDAINLNRRGEVSFRGSMRNSDAVAEFRSKLLSSGFFASVTVDEQSPTPDRQKVNLRMTAVWKPFAERQTLSFGPTA